jgi:hypothetical protein
MPMAHVTPRVVQMGEVSAFIYGIGEWFVPCEWSDQQCHAEAGEKGQDQPSKNLAGYHHFTAVWVSDSGQTKDATRRM